ncbi:hypothetical protein DFH09DRAFT_1467450 [Mycena vulgaris]|nr:hypothetical protein DFH09DRAFT_1467450 [Mycena vulgaris]
MMVVFPTLATVKGTVEHGARSLFCTRKKWEEKTFPRAAFHDSNSSGGPVLMHTKAEAGRGLGGRIELSWWDVNMYNFELGVVVPLATTEDVNKVSAWKRPLRKYSSKGLPWMRHQQTPLIFAGAIALWSLWPEDLYPGFPAVLRESDLIRREAAIAAASGAGNSEYSPPVGNLTGNRLHVVAKQLSIHGAACAASRQRRQGCTFAHDFGAGSSDVTNFTTPPFEGKDYVFIANSICASTCSVFSSYLFQKHGVRSAVFGGTPSSTVSQFDGGVKGSEITDFDSVLFELELAGLEDDPAAPQPFPVEASFSMNFRNAIPYIDKRDGILEYVFEQNTKKYQFTHEQFNKPQKIWWEFVAEEFFGQD